MAKSVAIAGRPNVGKSTLFNRLAGRKLALVHDTPGVTRDRREAAAALGDLRFTVIDTAGLDEGDKGFLAERAQAQTGAALDRAPTSCFSWSMRAPGSTRRDREIARGAAPLRQAHHPRREQGRARSRAGRAISTRSASASRSPISAEHGEGLGRSLRGAGAVSGRGRPKTSREAPTSRCRLAVIGRPNVGKSSLVNRLLGRGADAHRPGSRHHPRRDREPVALARPAPSASLTRRGCAAGPRVAEKLEQLSVDGYAERGPLRRGLRAGRGRHPASRETGP